MTVAVKASACVVASASIRAIESDGAACVEKPVICVVVNAASAVVVSALSWAPLRIPICATVKAAMSVVFKLAIVVVERLAICALDSELMNDVIANPQSAPIEPTHVRANHIPCFAAVDLGYRDILASQDYAM